jgi:hypothetical protein
MVDADTLASYLRPRTWFDESKSIHRSTIDIRRRHLEAFL